MQFTNHRELVYDELPVTLQFAYFRDEMVLEIVFEIPCERLVETFFELHYRFIQKERRFLETILIIASEVEFADLFRNQRSIFVDHQCQGFLVSLFYQIDDLKIVIIAKQQLRSLLSAQYVEYYDCGAHGSVQTVDLANHRYFHKQIAMFLE